MNQHALTQLESVQPRFMIHAKNHWEQAALDRYATVADVEQALARCKCGLEAAPMAAKKREWQSKIEFLDQLRLWLTLES